VGAPVFSVDELVGNYRNNGHKWQANGAPEEVNVHDFIDPDLPRASMTSPTKSDG